MIKNLIFFILEILSILTLIILTPVYFLIRAVSKKPSAGFLTKAGDYKEAAKHMVHISERVEPNKEMTQIYQKKYEKYLFSAFYPR